MKALLEFVGEQWSWGIQQAKEVAAKYGVEEGDDGILEMGFKKSLKGPKGSIPRLLCDTR